MIKVVNEWGIEFDYELAVNLMDDDLREELNFQIAPCTEQEFFTAYVQSHTDKFGEEWELAKQNPAF